MRRAVLSLALGACLLFCGCECYGGILFDHGHVVYANGYPVTCKVPAQAQKAKK